jgi:uncharacterized protein
VVIAAVTGCAGGTYGAGGGSALAPVLITDGHPPSRAAPAALASTFVTSVTGVLTFTVLAANHQGPPPDWPTGISLLEWQDRRMQARNSRSYGEPQSSGAAQ